MLALYSNSSAFVLMIEKLNIKKKNCQLMSLGAPKNLHAHRFSFSFLAALELRADTVVLDI